MKRKTLFSILATAAFGIVMAGPASAADEFTWTAAGDGTDWKDADNWSSTGGGYPDDAGDKATVKDVAGADNDPILDLETSDLTIGDLVIEDDGFLIVKDTNGAANSLILTASDVNRDGKLTIANGGLLDIQAGGVVDLASASITHVIAGELRLSTSTSDLKVSADNITLDEGGAFAPGTVNGQHNDAEIIIADSAKLINEINIVGQMTIKEANSSGTFKNGSTGVVLSDVDGGAILLASGLTLDDASNASWAAVGNAGFTTQPVLKFDVGASCLDGNFVISGCGEILLNNVSIDTTGSYSNSAGRLTLSENKHFGHSCNTGCTNCTTIDESQCIGSCGC